MPPDAFDAFRAASATALYRPRQVAFSEGNPAAGLYLLCSGLVKLYHSDRFGRDNILEIAGPGAVLGEIPVNTHRALSVSAEAITECQLCLLPRERLVPFLRSYPLVAVRLVSALSRELGAARRKVRDLALKGAESRLAGLLVDLARGSGGLSTGRCLPMRYTRRELGEMIGVSTETAIRLLAKLKEKRAIRIERRAVVICDVEKLTQVANYDDADPTAGA
ncbi:MAG: Crp/Fnr family transcriptional regulator [Candidatus Binatia bacterium]